MLLGDVPKVKLAIWQNEQRKSGLSTLLVLELLIGSGIGGRGAASPSFHPPPPTHFSGREVVPPTLQCQCDIHSVCVHTVNSHIVMSCPLETYNNYTCNCTMS